MAQGQTNRKKFLETLALVRPGLASQPYIPALTHVCFHDPYVTAFNDVLAISVKDAASIERCIPGESLIKALGSFTGEEVLVQEGKDGGVTISSGRGRVKLPTLALDQFPLTLPKRSAGAKIELEKGIIAGIARCLVSVGSDPTHPAHMGVTLEVGARGRAVLWSTDNKTISRFMTGEKIDLPAGAPIILPTLFCEQLVKLAGIFGDVTLYAHEGALVAEIGEDADAILFTKTLVDLTPMDFNRVLKKQVDLDALDELLSEIPPGFDGALDRALLVLSNQADKATALSTGDGSMRLHSESDLGDADDRLPFKGADDHSCRVDPALVARGLKTCSHITFGANSLVMTDGNKGGAFLHLVAYVQDKK